MLTEGGRILNCGDNQNGQLGLSDTEERSVPTEVTGLGSQRVVSIAAGENYSLAVCPGGAVHLWGRWFDSNTGNLTRPSQLWVFPPRV